MRIAIIRNNVVDNIIVCDSVELAQQLVPDALCVDGSELNIGDSYPEPQPTALDPEKTANTDRDAMLIDHEYRLTLLELGVI